MSTVQVGEQSRLSSQRESPFRHQAIFLIAVAYAAALAEPAAIDAAPGLPPLHAPDPWSCMASVRANFGALVANLISTRIPSAWAS